MNRSRQVRWWLALGVAGQWLIAPVFGGTVPGISTPVKLFSVSTNRTLTSPGPRSPVALFRQLLAMTPEDREAFLTNRPPPIRERILAKVDEYAALDPNERELRLRATELRWYLLPLMQEPPDRRASRLAQVPVDMRELVKSRLGEWSILPPSLQQEFLENERTLRYFANVDVSNGPPLPPSAPPGSDAARWSTMTEDQRKNIAAGVNRFFELTSDEKQAALGTLSDAERRQMEKTLQAFDQLPPDQRDECTHAFAKFAGMSTIEKQEFLKNAERWSRMSPADRQAWRDLVMNVPAWPPLPSSADVPPPLPPLPSDFHPVAATNPN
jgi:hypothetical protein